jgi:cobalamin synthase
MGWIVLFGAIALLGLGMVVAFGFWLTRKLSGLAGEVAGLATQGGQLLDLLAQIDVQAGGNSSLTVSPRGVDSEADVE